MGTDSIYCLKISNILSSTFIAPCCVFEVWYFDYQESNEYCPSLAIKIQFFAIQALIKINRFDWWKVIIHYNL